MAPPRRSALPKPLPDGFILTDTEKKKWRLGKIIGQGGFGLIYLASQDTGKPVAEDTDFAIKVEYQENGPLFSELKFYQRAAKADSIQKWKRDKKLDFLGIPTYSGSGLAEYGGLRYRFMAMDRLGSDLQRVCERNKGRLKKTTVLQLGQRLVDVLEYIHENEYVHADIKAANLMQGYRDPEQVYLVDYGLSYRYCPDGVHKEYKENPKKGHNGTIEYTSLDAHKGLSPSRRGDLQILGFCLLHWLCGSLPWDNVLKNPSEVQEAKARLMNNLPDSVQQMSVSVASTDEVASFLLYVKTLDYHDKPDYQHVKDLFASAVSGRLDFSMPGRPVGSATKELCKEEKKERADRGPSKTKPVPAEVDDEEPHRVKQVPAHYIRAPPLTKLQTQQKKDVLPAVRRSPRPRIVRSYEEDDGEEEEEDEEEDVRPKHIPARYRRGPPKSPVAQPEQKEDVSPAVRRSPRPRIVRSYEEDDGEEEEEDEEEDVRPKHIPARYRRGPPKSPVAQPEQRTKSKETSMKTDYLTVTFGRQKLHPQRKEHVWMQGDGERQVHMDYSEERDERLHHRVAYSQELKCSVPRDPRQEAPPTQRDRCMSWFGYLGVFILFTAVLVFIQSTFKPL